MRKLVVLLIVSCYSLGNILFPNVDMAHLYEMYKHCEVEDPDIDPVDFVFEHLLSVPDIFDGFGQDDDEENEKPHQPTHLVNSNQIAVVLTKPIQLWHEPVILHCTTIIYGSFIDQNLPTGFESEMLRPPIV